MTRPNLIRFALISAAALAAGVLSAALAHSASGVAASARFLFIVVVTGGGASLGWHGVKIALERHEERKRAERRHRVPRTDRLPSRRPEPEEWLPESAPDAPPSMRRREPSTGLFTGEPGKSWFESQRPEDFYTEDLYAHPSGSST